MVRTDRPFLFAREEQPLTKSKEEDDTMAKPIKPTLKREAHISIIRAGTSRVKVDATPAFQFVARLERFAAMIENSNLTDSTKEEGTALLNMLAQYAGTFIEIETR